MYTANHMDVEAIVALTESGSTPLWMSRIRSDIPIFAFTRHLRTQRRGRALSWRLPDPVRTSSDGELRRAVPRDRRVSSSHAASSRAATG